MRLKNSSKNKNVTININILNNANISGKKSWQIIGIIVAVLLTGVICYRLLTMSGSDFTSILGKLLELLSRIVVSC